MRVSGDHETRAEIVIEKTGPVPARVELSADIGADGGPPAAAAH